MTKVNYNNYELLNSYLFEVHFKDGRLTDATLEDFVSDLLLQYHTFLYSENTGTPADFWETFTKDTIKLVKKHRDESEADVKSYLKSMKFYDANIRVILQLQPS